jgi:hypothetical protein
MPELDPVPGVVAWRWALVPVLVCGDAWWYGYAPVERDDEVRVGWYLLPRDPLTDPGPYDIEEPHGL